MPIPDFQSLMLPIMKIAQDGAEHAARELRQRIGDELGLTQEERQELLPSGAQPVFTNRIAWARSHLTMAGLLEKTGRGASELPNAAKRQWRPNLRALIFDFCFSFLNTRKREAERKLIHLSRFLRTYLRVTPHRRKSE